METLKLTALPLLLLACRTPIDGSLHDDPVEPGANLFVDSVDATPEKHDVHCIQEIGLTQSWETEWAPYGIWNGLLSFSPDSEDLLLSFGLYDEVSILVDAQTGQNRSADEGSRILHRDRAWSVDLRSSLQLTEVETGEILFSLDENPNGQTDLWSMEHDVRLSKNGEWATSFGNRGDENILALWHIPSQRLVGEMKTGLENEAPYWDGRIHNADLSDQGILYFSRQASGTLHRADVRKQEMLSAEFNDDFLTTLVLSDDGRTLFSAGTSGEIRRHRASDLTPMGAELQSSTNLLNSNIYAPQYFASPIAQSPDGQLWASLDWDGNVVIRNQCSDFVLDGIATPEDDGNGSWGNSMGAYALAFDATGTRLAIAREGLLELWQLEVLD